MSSPHSVRQTRVGFKPASARYLNRALTLQAKRQGPQVRTSLTTSNCLFAIGPRLCHGVPLRHWAEHGVFGTFDYVGCLSGCK